MFFFFMYILCLQIIRVSSVSVRKRNRFGCLQIVGPILGKKSQTPKADYSK